MQMDTLPLQMRMCRPQDQIVLGFGSGLGVGFWSGFQMKRLPLRVHRLTPAVALGEGKGK